MYQGVGKGGDLDERLVNFSVGPGIGDGGWMDKCTRWLEEEGIF